MNEQSSTSEQPAVAWRLRLGITLLILSILLPLAGIPFVAEMNISNSVIATVSGAILIGAEVIGVLAIAVMGKSGYTHIKSRVLSFLKHHGPPEVVSPRRYGIGLVMFIIPFLFAWLSVYIAEWIPGFTDNLVPYAVAGDFVLLTSLFILGGDFWDKIRALFIYNAKVNFQGNTNE